MNKNKVILVILVVIFLAQLTVNIFFLVKPKADNGQETERKFLISKDKIPYSLSSLEKYSFEQAYINFSPEIRVRKVDDNLFILTVKAPIDDKGLIREEREFVITREEYSNLLKKKEGNIINKDRYYFTEKGQLMSIDIYSGQLSGLEVLEIEFKNNQVADKFIQPTWVEREITQDKKYKNGNLAKDGLEKTDMR